MFLLVCYKCFKIEFLASYICSLTVEKKSWTYSFPYFDIFILSEWHDKGVAIATWEENKMAAQKRKF